MQRRTKQKGLGFSEKQNSCCDKKKITIVLSQLFVNNFSKKKKLRGKSFKKLLETREKD